MTQSFTYQLFYLFILAIPVACIAWKIFYLFTCEYCFSHYVVLFFISITKFQLLYTDWRGYLIAFFSVVWIANIYMSLFGFIRVGMKKEGVEAKIKEIELNECKEELANETTRTHASKTD